MPPLPLLSAGKSAKIAHMEVKLEKLKRIAAVNDVSGFGKCSLTVALPVLSVMGAQC